MAEEEDARERGVVCAGVAVCGNRNVRLLVGVVGDDLCGIV